MSEYEIVFQIRRARDFGAEAGEEIGFGASGAWSSTSAALYAVVTIVQRGEWETEPGMPDPADVLAAIAAEADL